MKIRLGQVFYGMGPHGYAVLGSSPLAKWAEGDVKVLCGMIGTPSVALDGSFVLASRPVGDSVLLVRACAGALDPNGRRTMLFHVLVAKGADLAAAGQDAFSISEKGLFLSSVPKGEVTDIEVETGAASPWRAMPPFDVSCPAVLRLVKPDVPLVRSLLGSRANSLTWSTFSETAQPSFDICVVDMYAALPDEKSIYDSKGLTRGASMARKPAVPVSAPTGRQPKHRHAGISTMIKFSILLNVVLAVFCFVLLRSRKTAKPEESKIHATAAVVDHSHENELVGLRREIAAYNDLLNGFSRDNVIWNWDEVVASSAYLSMMKKPVNLAYEGETAVYGKITANINFVKSIFELHSKGEKRNE